MASNYLFFSGNDAAGDNGLWISDGTAAGTHEITDIQGADASGISPSAITVVDGHVFFLGLDASGGYALWETTATGANTHQVSPDLGGDVQSFNVLGNTLVTSDSQGNLWSTNAATGATSEISGVTGEGSAGFAIEPLEVVDNQLWFVGTDAEGNRSLWETDGTVAGTKELISGFGDVRPFAAYNDTLVYTDPNGNLWSTDGTVGGTEEIAFSGNDDTPPTGEANNAEGAAYLNGLLLFDIDNQEAQGVYAYDGSTATQIATRIVGTYGNGDVFQPGGPIVIFTDDLYQAGVVDGQTVYSTTGTAVPAAYFTAGFDTLTTQGDAASTVGVGLLAGGGNNNAQGLTPEYGLLFFTVSNEGDEFPDLFATAGANPLTGDADTTSVDFASDISGGGGDATDLTPFDGSLYFNGQGTSFHGELFELTPYGAGGNFIELDNGGQLVASASGGVLSVAGESSTLGLNPSDLTVVNGVTTTVANLFGGETVLPAGDALIIDDTAGAIEGLTPEQMGQLSGLGVGQVVADGSLLLNVAQALALTDPVMLSVPPGDSVTVNDSAGAIEGLTPDQIEALEQIGVTGIIGGSAVGLSVAQALALEAGNLAVTAPGGVGISDLAGQIETLTTSEIAGLDGIGVSSVTASDGALPLSIAQINALNGATIALGGSVDIADTAADIESLAANTAEVAAFAGAGETGITVTGGTLDIPIAQAVTLAADGFHISPAGWSVTGTQAAIQALTPQQLLALSSAGVTQLVPTGNSLQFSVANFRAIAAAGLELSPHFPQYLTISDTAADIETLSPAEIAALPALGLTNYAPIVVTDASLNLTLAQYLAFYGAGLMVSVPNGDSFNVADSAATLDTLTPTDLVDIHQIGGTPVSDIVSDGPLTLSIADAQQLIGEYRPTNLEVPNGDNISVADTAANFESLDPGALQNVASYFRLFAATDASVVLSVAQAQALANQGARLTVPAGDSVSIADSAANIEAVDPNATENFEGIATDLGAVTITATDEPLVFTAAQAADLANSPGDTGAGPLTVSSLFGSVTVSDSEVAIDGLTATQIAELPRVGIFQIDVPSLTGLAPITIDGGVTLDVAGAIGAAQTLSFTYGGGTLELGDPADMAGTIDGFALPDVIDLPTVADDVDLFATLDANNVIEVIDSGTTLDTITLDSAASFSSNLFPTTPDGQGGTDIAVACFTTGTRLLTMRGEVAVEGLRIGDLMPTGSGRLRPVTWIGWRRTRCATHPRPHDIMPVSVMAGAFGASLPSHDLFLSPDHAVFADGHLVPVRYLINGASIVQEACESVTYWHVELDGHDVLLAEGLACESYLDTGNRAAFGNAPDVVALTPDFAAAQTARAVWAAGGCAPILTDPAEATLRALHLRLLARITKQRSAAAARHRRTGGVAGF